MATQYSEKIVSSERKAFGIATPYVIRKIGLSDLSDALRLGWEDFKAVPSHAIVLCVIYPVLGAATALSAGRWFYVDWSFCRAWSL